MTFKLTMTVDYLGRPYGFITKDGERVWEDRSWTIEESEIAKGHAAAKLQELVYEDRESKQDQQHQGITKVLYDNAQHIFRLMESFPTLYESPFHAPNCRLRVLHPEPMCPAPRAQP